MARRRDKLEASGLEITPVMERAMRISGRLARMADWSDRIAARKRPPGKALAFGVRRFERFDVANHSGTWAEELAERFAPVEAPPGTADLPLATYAPPQRQISSARQGAAGWPPGATAPAPGEAEAPSPAGLSFAEMMARLNKKSPT